MIMAFSFGFSGDDVGAEDVEISDDGLNISAQNDMTTSLPTLAQADKHNVDEWVRPSFPRYVIYMFQPPVLMPYPVPRMSTVVRLK